MTDPQTDPASNPPAADDKLYNKTKELERKLGDTNSAIAAMKAQNDELLKRLEALSKPAQAPTSTQEDLSELIYKDPQRYAEIITERATKQAEARISGTLQSQARTQQTLSQLAAEFPELADQNHDLTKKAVEIYSAMSDEDKASPLSYRAAVKEAAMDLGIKPKSKRSVDDEPVHGGSGGGGAAPRKPKLDKATLELAERLGLDVSDAKVRDRLAERAQRNWMQYAPPIPVKR